MTLTRSGGPLSGDPPSTVNYELDGPKHRLLFQDFPRRVRARLGGETVADTRRGKLLHETGILPRLYIPDEDIRADLLEATDHTTHCPFKGDASYRSVRVGDRVAENAIWSYRDPIETAGWLRGYSSIYWEAMDEWLDEDEPVEGHLRDPYSRVDVRRSSLHVRVSRGDQVVAETDRPLVLSETGLPNRYYVPPDDVDFALLTPSPTRTVCPYKGTASYHSLGEVADVAWCYEDPFDEVAKIRGCLAFYPERVTVEVDGHPFP